ncbi:MAG: hypothetical protein R3263_11450, partial [Myxococcota bacterium]|nr:hypothetical protein [Myxococcota bacterium]
MGKGTLIIVTMAVFLAAAASVALKQTGLETDRQQAAHHEQVIARQIAESALSQGVSEVKR